MGRRRPAMRACARQPHRVQFLPADKVEEAKLVAARGQRAAVGMDDWAVNVVQAARAAGRSTRSSRPAAKRHNRTLLPLYSGPSRRSSELNCSPPGMVSSIRPATASQSRI